MHNLWYVRRAKRVEGPFPREIFTCSIARGLVQSTEGLSWKTVPGCERQFSAAGEGD